MKPRVIVDTSAWIDFLRGTRSRDAGEVESLIRSDRAVTCGIIEAELLAGVRARREHDALKESLGGLVYVEVTRADWARTGELAAQLRARGKTIPLSDLLVAALALANDCRVLTRDNHFRHIPGLKLHQPD